MPATSVIRERADELRRLPTITPLRIFWILRREFRNAERDQLVNAARLEGHRRGITPDGGRLNPVVIRYQRKGRPEIPVVKSERKVIAMDYPLMTVEANDLRVNDWIDGFTSSVRELRVYSTLVHVRFANGDDHFFGPRDHVTVRLEDEGIDVPTKGE